MRGCIGRVVRRESRVGIGATPRQAVSNELTGPVTAMATRSAPTIIAAMPNVVTVMNIRYPTIHGLLRRAHSSRRRDPTAARPPP